MHVGYESRPGWEEQGGLATPEETGVMRAVLDGRDWSLKRKAALKYLRLHGQISYRPVCWAHSRRTDWSPGPWKWHSSRRPTPPPNDDGHDVAVLDPYQGVAPTKRWAELGLKAPPVSHQHPFAPVSPIDHFQRTHSDGAGARQLEDWAQAKVATTGLPRD